MTLFRVDVSNETEAVTLYVKSACGLRPLIGWPNLDGMKDFAEMLLDIYYRRNMEKGQVRKASVNILKQVLENDAALLEKELLAE